MPGKQFVRRRKTSVRFVEYVTTVLASAPKPPLDHLFGDRLHDLSVKVRDQRRLRLIEACLASASGLAPEAASEAALLPAAAVDEAIRRFRSHAEEIGFVPAVPKGQLLGSELRGEQTPLMHFMRTYANWLNEHGALIRQNAHVVSASLLPGSTTVLRLRVASQLVPLLRVFATLRSTGAKPILHLGEDHFLPTDFTTQDAVRRAGVAVSETRGAKQWFATLSFGYVDTRTAQPDADQSRFLPRILDMAGGVVLTGLVIILSFQRFEEEKEL